MEKQIVYTVTEVLPDLSKKKIECFDVKADSINFLTQYIDTEYIQKKIYRVYQIGSSEFVIYKPGYLYGKTLVCKLDIMEIDI